MQGMSIVLTERPELPVYLRFRQQSLHELLSPAETGMHSRALHYNLEHEVFCWVVEAPRSVVGAASLARHASKPGWS